MEEKKQTNKLSYSVFGKHFRGFLCMVTFCVFCVSAMLTTYVVGVYNPDIVTNPATKYDETNQYQDELFCEISTLLHNINEMDCYDVSKEEISILDMSEQKEYFYDALLMGEANYNDVFEADYLEEMADYEIKNVVSLEDRELEEYENMKTYLESDTVSDYLYFDEESFRALFENDGLQNTDCRFSDKFSEDAYFIFENYEVTTKRESRKSLDVTTESKETEEENIEATTEVVEESTDSEEDVNSTEPVEDYEIMDGDESDVEVEKTTMVETEQVVITPYNLTSYAVYDPEQDIYYSTWDEYFSPMTSYAYSTEELLGFIQLMEEDGTQYNSLVIPLLKCYNTGLGEIAGGASETYNNVIVADSHLQSISERNIMFYFLQDDSKCYMNMSEPEMVKEAEIWYGFEKLTSGDVIQTHSDNVVDLQDTSEVEACFEEYPSGAFLYVGFSPQSLDVWGVQYYSIVRHYKEYPFLAKYSLMFAILTVVSFILLLIQAVWLIRTTGKTCKEDTEVSLNFFDRLYTEIWFVISGIILLAAACIAAIGLDWMLYDTSLELMCVCAGGGALPFGFAFMVLTLSFVRRVKAHNFWNRMLIVKCVKAILHNAKNKAINEDALEDKEQSPFIKKLAKIWNRCKEAYYGIKGTRKLLLAFIIFMIVEMIVVFIGVDSVAHKETAFFMFLILQAIALFVVVWVVKDIDKLTMGVNEITKGNLDSKVEINEKISVFGDLADGINHIGDGLKNAVETSLKDERMKTELITNVSHDLKTPLTSIINYIDLLKKEDIQGENAKHYIDVLDAKAQRLKQLTEDLVEAAKATSGNIELEMMPLTFDELMKQALGEFEDKFEKRNLTIIASYPKKPAVVMADGRRLFRIIENVLQNIYKYALEGTRVYADLEAENGVVTFTLKNVSAAPLNISPDELMERFTRGDSSRTTDGSGLGLSIAKDLTRLQNGEFEIQLDGDLFKVIIRFPEYQ